MLGAIIGDIVGSRWEFNRTNDYNFELFSDKNSFTDDTICTIAVADALLNGRDYGESIHEWCRKYPHPMGGYGGRFAKWVNYLVNSDEVFGLEYEVVETAPDASTDFLKDSSDPIRGCAAVLIFILCLYSASSYFGKAGRFFKALGRKEKVVSLFLYELSSVLIPAVCGFVMIRILHPAEVSVLKDALIYIIFIAFSCIWSGIFVHFFRKTEHYLPAVSVLMFVCFAICPVFFDIAGYFPVIRYITSFLPPAFYLYML